MPTPRIVLDTNAVLMPITREYSSDAWIREFWQEGRIKPLTSSATRDELIGTLRRLRFGLDEQEVGALSALYLSYCEEVPITDPPPETPECRDTSDQPFIILAYVAQADYIVTRDPDLLALRDESRVPIITPSELWSILEASP